MLFAQHNIIFFAQGQTIRVTLIHSKIIVLCDMIVVVSIPNNKMSLCRDIDTEICFVAASDNKKDFLFLSAMM